MIMLFPPQGHVNIPRPMATPPSLPAGASIPSDRSYKLDLIARLPKPPQLVIFGDSRGQRFEPAQFERLTGLRTFNACFSNGRPLEAWAYTNYLLAEYPHTTLRCFWAVQPTTLYPKPIDPGLVQDPRLARAFSQGFIDHAAREQIATMYVEKPMLWYAGGFAADGHVIHNWHDDMPAGPAALDAAIRREVAITLSKRVKHRGKSWSDNATYLAATIGLFNSIGVEPVLAVMPTHPLAIELVGRARWERQRDRFMAFMQSLKRHYRFVLLDYSEVKKFGGDPGAFYDGMHMRAENARRLAAVALKQAAPAFEPIGTPAVMAGSVTGPPAAGRGRE